METIVNLTSKFKHYDLFKHGEVLVIPLEQFKDEWKNDFARQGHECIEGKFGAENTPVIFLKLGIDVELMRKASTMIPAPAVVHGCRKGADWNPTDEQRLMKRMSEATGTKLEKIAQVVSEFPGRSAGALNQKYIKLRSAMKKAPPEKLEVMNFEECVAKAKYALFGEIWIAAKDNDADLKQRAEAFYNAAVEVNLPGAILGSVISCFEELDALRKCYDDQTSDLQKFTAGINDKLVALRKEFIEHKHADKTGETMLPPKAEP